MVHNLVIERPDPNAPEGIGELWFDSPEGMERAMSSAEAAAAAVAGHFTFTSKNNAS
jgi:hypothetical protein